MQWKVLRIAEVLLLVMVPAGIPHRIQDRSQAGPVAKNTIIQDTPIQNENIVSTKSKVPAEGCSVRVDQVGPQSRAGTAVSVSAPQHCSCSWLVLQVLQQHGTACSTIRPGCSWRFAHQARYRRQATFLVPVQGRYRAIGNCPHYSRSQPLQLPGVRPTLWEVDIHVRRISTSHVSVWIARQYSNDTDAASEEETVVPFFPRLAVSVVEQETGLRLLHRKVAAMSDGSVAMNLTGLPLRPYHSYYLLVTPGDSWVCQGANRGCQRRYAAVPKMRQR